MLLNIKLVVVLSLSSSPYMEMMTTDRTREEIKLEPKKKERKRKERKRKHGYISRAWREREER